MNDIQAILKQHLSPSQIVMDVMVVCMIIGAIDHLTGNRRGLGKSFQEGFNAFGSLAITMTGVIALVPLIKQYLVPLVAPLCRALGFDPAMFAGMLLACDMGGYPLALEIADSAEAAGLSGMLLGSMMGATIVFNIPASLGIIPAADRPYMAKGVLYGFITIPLGCLTGGLAAGYSAGLLFMNLIPVIFVSVLIFVLLLLIPEILTRVFLIFGRIISISACVAAVLSIVTELTGITVVPGLGSVWEGMDTVVAIVLVLPGAYVLVEIVSKLLKKPFARLGRLLGINEKSSLGLVTTLANAVPTFALIGDMDPRGKVLNYAFLVSAGYLLGDHLAFCSAMDASLTLPMIIGKLTAALSSLAIAIFMTRPGKTIR